MTQQVVNALTLGSVIALFALGYSMVYGILTILNFAHGEVFMIGAFVGYLVETAFIRDNQLTANPILIILLALLAAMLACGLLAVTIEFLGPLAVALLVVGIGNSLGGPTGYAINPARDLGPRIAHAVLPIPGKGGGDWGYSWIPVVGPIIGAVLAGLLFMGVFA